MFHAIARLSLFYAFAVLGGIAKPAHADSLETAANRLSDALAPHLSCTPGTTARLGIFPFDEADLPIAPARAFALYEIFLGHLLDVLPDCVRLIDGRGAFVTLEYLSRGESLRESGQQQRQDIRDSLQQAAFVMDGSLIETGSGLIVVFRLTAMASGIAIGRAEAAVPDAVQAQSCDDGALTESVALRSLSDSILQRSSAVSRLLVFGGRHAPSGAITEVGQYLEDRLLSYFAQGVENHMTEATLSISGTDTPIEPAQGEHALHLRYWPCDGNQAARLSATLRAPDGRNITEHRTISLRAMPAGLALLPPTPPDPRGQLHVSPRIVGLGDEITLLAAPPPACNPFFFNLAPSGTITPIPLEFFRQLDLGAGTIRYEISPAWDFGLAVTPDDEAGLNHLGYLCQPAAMGAATEMHGLLHEIYDRLPDQVDGRLVLDHGVSVFYQVQGFEIRK
ncbi:MAG: hypothetical protein JJU24_12110 [Natronohydrobacter sp.]|nr:hypothetical protein [Natronohydrobacter sp.]